MLSLRLRAPRLVRRARISPLVGPLCHVRPCSHLTKNLEYFGSVQKSEQQKITDNLGNVSPLLVSTVIESLGGILSSESRRESLKQQLSIPQDISHLKDLYSSDDELGVDALRMFLGAVLGGYEASVIVACRLAHVESPPTPWLDALDLQPDDVKLIVPIDLEEVTQKNMYQFLKKLSSKSMSSFEPCTSETELHASLTELGLNLPSIETSLWAAVSKWKEKKYQFRQSQLEASSLGQGQTKVKSKAVSNAKKMFEKLKDVTVGEVDVVEPDGTSSKASLLEMPEGSAWMGGGPFRTLFVRDFYERFYNMHFGDWKNKSFGEKVIVLGSSGIGKSAFSNYAMWRALRQGRQVALFDQDGQYNLIDPKEGFIASGNKSDIDVKELLGDPELLVIYDSCRPLNYAATGASVLLVTSLRKDVYHQFNKDGALVQYFPVWTAGELEALRRTCYSHVPADIAQGLYECWGGIPRYVLARLDKVSQRDFFTAVCSTYLNSNFLALLRDENTDAASFPDRVVHINVDRDSFDSSQAIIASPLAQKLLEVKYQSHNLRKASALLTTSFDLPQLKKLTGEMFEVMAHKVLMKGGEYRVKQLWSRKGAHPTDKNTSLITIPESKEKFFSNISDIQSFLKEGGEEAVYLRPKSKNFPAIDSVLACSPPKFFQMGIGAHNVQLAGPSNPNRFEVLLQALNLSSSDDFVDIFFVAPEPRFSEWVDIVSDGKNPILFYRGEPPSVPNPEEDPLIKWIRVFALEIKDKQLEDSIADQSFKTLIERRIAAATEWFRQNRSPSP